MAVGKQSGNLECSKLAPYVLKRLEGDEGEGTVAFLRYSTFQANLAKTGGLIFVTLISFSKLHFLYLT